MNILKIVQGWVKLKGASDGTFIGNEDDSLKVSSVPSDKSMIDAFGRERVSEPRNVFEWQFRYDSAFDRYWTTSSANGGAHGTDSDKAVHFMTIDTQAGSEAIMQTRRRIEYVPGKSQDVMMTFNFLGLESDKDIRYGLYDENNGLFIQGNGTTLQLVIRSAISGSVVDTAITQANWNQDKLDGTGPSGLTLDMSKHQLFRITYAFLGIGDVAFSFFIDGKWRIAHIQRNANSLTGMYMQSGILPLRSEIKAIGTPAAQRRIELACVSVASEGKETKIGRVRNGNTGASAISFSGTETFGFAIRIKSTFPYSSVLGLAYTLLAASGKNEAIYRVYFNPTLTGATWADNPDSITQSVTNTPTFTGGLLVGSGYINLSGSSGRSVQNLLLNTDIFLGFALNNVPDILMITLESTSGNGSAYFSGSWREIF